MIGDQADLRVGGEGELQFHIRPLREFPGRLVAVQQDNRDPGEEGSATRETLLNIRRVQIIHEDGVTTQVVEQGQVVALGFEG